MSEPVLVVDVGSSCVKAGFSGEDTPSSVFPATTGKWSAGVDAVEAHSSEALAGINLEFPANTPFPHPIHRGAVKDFEQLEKLWQTILSGAGVSTPEGTSCLLVEPLRSSAADRLKWAEIIFEGHHHAPSMCIGNGSSLALFAAGRTTGVVVECGAGLTSSVPVFEGLALSHAAISWEYGGQDISLSLRKLLAEHTGVQVDMADTRLVKEQLARVSVSGPAKSGKDALHVNLPDGTEVVVDKGIFSVCTEKLLVDPKSVHGGLISQVYESISLCDDTIRRDLAKNIILSGGTSMLNGRFVRLIVFDVVPFQCFIDSPLSPFLYAYRLEMTD